MTTQDADHAQDGRVEIAAFIPREAASIGMRVGTDGCDLIIAPARGMPSASYFSLAIIEHRDEIIDIIVMRGTP